MSSHGVRDDLTFTIGGDAVGSDRRVDVVNPSTGGLAGRAPAASDGQLDAAFEAAHRAFAVWRHDDDARRAGLRAAADAIAATVDDVAPLLVAEQGKPLVNARGELDGAAAWLRYYADLDLPTETLQDDAAARVDVVRRPIGPVAAIAPWNFPVLLAMWKVGPALRAGNTVVLKPSPFTPLSTLRVGEILRDVLPAGVLNVVSGGDELGARMTGHPLARKVSFTGSIETGRKVAVSAARDLKRVTLELGGNDPAILLEDVDPDAVAEALFASAFANNGQVCAAIKRIYAPRRIYDQLVEALAARAAAARVGDGMDPASTLGPVQNRPQRQRVAGLVADALRRGAVAAAGGHAIDGPGSFYAPTILAHADDGMPIVDEEQFGPALPVVPYTDVEDALARANATSYGLGASVWTTDEDRGVALAHRLEAGTTWINTHGDVAPHVPFGGAKWSGIGVENGPWGLYGFTDLGIVHRAR